VLLAGCGGGDSARPLGMGQVNTVLPDAASGEGGCCP
jgi:hypothetical protein